MSCFMHSIYYTHFNKPLYYKSMKGYIDINQFTYDFKYLKYQSVQNYNINVNIIITKVVNNILTISIPTSN